MESDNLQNMLETLGKYTSLGHSKRDKTFLRQVECLCLHPGGTGSGASTDFADAVSAYRFAGSESVDIADIRKARMNAALESVPEDETILVINDVSILDYYNHESKKDRRRVGNERGRGYEYVCNLGISLRSEQCLGVLHDCIISADGPDDAGQVGYHNDSHFAELSKCEPSRLECNHKHILKSHVGYIARHAPSRHMVITADREFDDHFIFEESKVNGTDFVIRSNASRNVQVSSVGWLPEGTATEKYAGLPRLPGHVCCSMKTLVENVPLKPYKKIPLDGKGRLTDEKSAQTYASVSIGHFQVTLYRNAKRNKKYHSPKDYVPLNVVVVKEPNPPKGRKAIEWVLYTSLPVDTEEQIGKIVRIYELRWVIECFFKYLKSGFRIEDLRYDNARKTARHLVAITIAAAFIYNLKMVLGLPRAAKLPPEDYTRVKEASKNLNDKSIDADLRLFALIAVQGGWRGRKADPISPLTLIKGFRKVSAAVEILQQASSLVKHFSNFLGAD